MHEKDCHVDPVFRPVSREEIATATKVVLAVTGMGCPTCANRVRNGLMEVEGVVLVEVDLHQALAYVAYEESNLQPEDLVLAVSRAGAESHHEYRARLATEPSA